MALRDDWHLDKRVQISTIAAMLIQLVVLLVGGTVLVQELKQGIEMNSATIVTEAERIGAEVDATNRRVEFLERQMELTRAQAQEQAIQMGRIETKLETISSSLTRLVGFLERNNNMFNGGP